MSALTKIFLEAIKKVGKKINIHFCENGISENQLPLKTKQLWICYHRGIVHCGSQQQPTTKVTTPTTKTQSHKKQSHSYFFIDFFSFSPNGLHESNPL